MKNIKDNQLTKCIVKEWEEFEQDVEQALGNETRPIYIYELDKVFFDDKDGNEIKEYVALSKMSDYYDIKVASIHIDGVENVRVWIEY